MANCEAKKMKKKKKQSLTKIACMLKDHKPKLCCEYACYWAIAYEMETIEERLLSIRKFIKHT